MTTDHDAPVEAEHFIQVTVDQAPEPLRRLGRHLRDVLDEGQFKAAYGMLLAVAAYGPEGRVRNKAWDEERVAWLAANRAAPPSGEARIPIWSTNPTDRAVIEIINAARDVVQNELEIVNNGYIETVVRLRAALVKHGYMPLTDADETPPRPGEDAGERVPDLTRWRGAFRGSTLGDDDEREDLLAQRDKAVAERDDARAMIDALTHPADTFPGLAPPSAPLPEAARPSRG